MFERFTDHARSTVNHAVERAQTLGHPHVGTEHLLLGLLSVDGSLAHHTLTAAGITREGIEAELAARAGKPTPLLSDEDAAALRTIGIDLDVVLARIEASFGPGALAAHEHKERGLFGRRRRGSRLTPRTKKVLELSLREALRLHDRHIGTEHILLGLIREGEGLAVQLLTGSGVELRALKADVLDRMGKAA